MEINESSPKTIKNKANRNWPILFLKDAHLWEEVKVSIKSGIKIIMPQMVDKISTPQIKIAIPKKMRKNDLATVKSKPSLSILIRK